MLFLMAIEKSSRNYVGFIFWLACVIVESSNIVIRYYRNGRYVKTKTPLENGMQQELFKIRVVSPYILMLLNPLMCNKELKNGKI